MKLVNRKDVISVTVVLAKKKINNYRSPCATLRHYHIFSRITSTKCTENSKAMSTHRLYVNFNLQDGFIAIPEIFFLVLSLFVVGVVG